MRIFPAIFAFFSFYFMLPANLGATNDSLITLILTGKDPGERMTSAYELGKKNLTKDPQLLKKYMALALRDSTLVKKQIEVAKILNVLGIAYYYTSDYDSSEYVLRNAIYKSKMSGDKELASKCKMNLANTLKGKGEHHKALTIYFELLDNFRRLKDTLAVVKTLNDIGNVYIATANYELGMKFQKEALQYLDVYDNPGVKANVLNSIGFIFDNGTNKRTDSAIHYFRKSLEIKEKLGNLPGILITKNNLCTCIDQYKKNNESIRCFEELMALQRQAGDKTGLARSLSNLAVSYTKAGNYKKSNEFLSQSLPILYEIKNDNLIAKTFIKMAANYEALKDYKSAYEVYNKYEEYKDKFYLDEKAKEIIDLSARYDLEKKNRVIAEKDQEIARSENEKLLADVKLKNRNFVLLGLAAALLILAAFSFIIFQRGRSRAEKEKAKAVIAERDKGLKAIIDAQEEERIRIARELHDSVGNQLLALKMSWERLGAQGGEAASESKARVNSILKETMEEVRHVSHQMMPKLLNEFGCVPAIQDMLEKTLGNSGVNFNFETHNIDQRFDRKLEIAVFRVTQELISNVIKHSGANMVNVQLIKNEQYLILFVEDNGTGMKHKDPSKTGIGFTSIKSRINAINGEMNIVPGEHTGTLVTVRVPLLK